MQLLVVDNVKLYLFLDESCDAIKGGTIHESLRSR